MIRQLKHSRVLRDLWPNEMRLAYAGEEHRRNAPPRPFAAPESAMGFPRRPDASVVNEAIPLFYIGRNKNGMWVVRQADGRSGGLFLFKQSAVRFARRQSEPAGCAMMFVHEPFELDIMNQDSSCTKPVPATEKARQASSVVTVIRSVVTAWRTFIAHVSRSLASERRNRETIEKELFHDQYTLASKNDDDLPSP